MKLGISKGKVIGFISAFFLLLFSYTLLFINTNKHAEQTMWVVHAYKVITNLEFLASEYKSIELNFRNYLGKRSDEAKANYYISVQNTDSAYALVRQLTIDNPYHQLQLDTIKKEIDEKVEAIKSVMQSAEPAPDILLKDFFKDVVNPITASSAPFIKHIKKMQYYEDALLNERTEELKGFHNSILTINLASLVVALLLAIYSIYTYVKENEARQNTHEKSEQYKAELEGRVKELAEANKEIKALRTIEKFASTGRIARTIAHEVRNPLTNINLAAEQLKESTPDNEENAMLLDMVKRNGLRINQLISDLLNATKFSELKIEKKSLNKIIDQALELAEDRISLNQIKIEKYFANDICDIVVDEEKIKIAFLNIIVNALEAMENGKGVLKITSENFHSKCRVIFEDNGTGMSEETISKLFEPFFTSKEKGNGLGLANAQNIILNHKGKIEVESKEGKGTLFIVTLVLP